MKNDQGAAQSTPELLPCPFCTGPSHTEANGAVPGGRILVHDGARECPLSGHYVRVDRWNTRSTPDRNAVLESLLREAREQLNDTSAITDNLVWKSELGALVDRIDASLTSTPEPTDRNAVLEEAAAIFDAEAEKHRAAASECESDGHRNGPVWRQYQSAAIQAASRIRALKTTTSESTP